MNDRLTHGQRIGAFGAALDFDSLPPAVVEKLKLHLLDMIAVSYAFVREPVAASLVSMAERRRLLPQASIIGFPTGSSPAEAAFANATIGHGKDFDDVHVASITHPTVVVAPAVLALAESRAKNGRETLAAMALGIEVCVRLGLAGGQAMAARGIPPMTTCGALGAAAAAAKILDLDARRIAAAIGVAGSFASGSHQWTIDGGNAKLTTTGWAARSGVIAAQMAEQGFDGSMSAIEGQKGLLVAMAGPDAFDLDEPSAQLGERWETGGLQIKRFASCQGTQPYIHAALKLQREQLLDPNSIRLIEIKIGKGVGLSLSEPIATKRSPPDGYAAKFSIPFTVALAMLRGDVSLSDFEEGWDGAHGAAGLAQSVCHIVDPAFDEGAADRGYVRVAMRNGDIFEAEYRSSQESLGIADVQRKFEDCAAWLLSDSERAAIVDQVMTLEQAADAGQLMRSLRSRPKE